MTACDRNAAELASLKADNERLRAEIANLRRKASGETVPESVSGKPDMILGMNELWSQRFEDNASRSKQRLSNKTMRVTGLLDDISSENLGIYGVEKSRNVRVTAHLEKGYAAQIREGLGSLEEGMTITVQGKFLYDRMELEDATIVDKATGAVLTGDQLKAFGAVKSGEVVPPPGKK